MVSSAKKASAGFSVYWSLMKSKHSSIKILANTNHRALVLRAAKGNFEVWETSLPEIPSLFYLLLPPDGLTAVEVQPFFNLHFWMIAKK